jgi:8-amino-7-oxononanoate synthase
LLRDGTELRKRLWDRARELHQGLLDLGYPLGAGLSPVVAALLDTREQAIGLWRGLFEHGVYVNLILPPAAPGGKSLVRCSVSAAHTPAQVRTILSAFAELRDIAIGSPLATHG